MALWASLLIGLGGLPVSAGFDYAAERLARASGLSKQRFRGQKSTGEMPLKVDDAGLSKNAYKNFVVFFLFLPVANVIVSSVLYHLWKKEELKKAKQINKLGFIIFALQVVTYIIWSFVYRK